MKLSVKKLIPVATTFLLSVPFFAFAQGYGSENQIEAAITFGYYVSSIGFSIASIITYLAVLKFGKSSLGSIFSFLFIGTGIFFVVTIFQKLGGDYFGISDGSVDIWWHIMFYMAFFFYFHCFKLLIGLGGDEMQASSAIKIGSEKMWGIIALILLIIIFIIPGKVDSLVQSYDQSHFSQLGLHHFLAFLLAGVVGSYLISAKKNLGQIGKSIANPMTIAMWAFACQHFWELLFESWKTVDVTSEVGEGIEKIFLTIASICIIYASYRLRVFAKA